MVNKDGNARGRRKLQSTLFFRCRHGWHATAMVLRLLWVAWRRSRTEPGTPVLTGSEDDSSGLVLFCLGLRAGNMFRRGICGESCGVRVHIIYVVRGYQVINTKELRSQSSLKWSVLRSPKTLPSYPPRLRCMVCSRHTTACQALDQSTRAPNS